MKIFEIIKNIIDKLFKRQKIKKLPEPKEEVKKPNKEESIELYKKIKEETAEVENLTKEQLITFLLLGEQEIQFLNKKIESEKTQYNIYKRNIEYITKQLQQVN